MNKRILLDLQDKLCNNFSKYINYNSLVKDTHYNWRTVKEYVLTLEKMGMFKKPLCEYHDEIEAREK